MRADPATIDGLMDPVLELKNVTLVRGRTRVFEGLSLTIAHAEHTAVLGPNGAGKTSLIRMLTLPGGKVVSACPQNC